MEFWTELLKNLNWPKFDWAQDLIQLDKFNVLVRIIRIATSLVLDGAVDAVTKDVAAGILGHSSGRLEGGSGDDLNVNCDLSWLKFSCPAGVVQPWLNVSTARIPSRRSSSTSTLSPSTTGSA